MQFVKKIAALVAALCLVLTVSAASAEVLEVKIWDNVQLEGLQTIADLWTEQSGIDVNIQVVTWDEYWTLLEAGATGGSLPDVFWMHSNSAQMYMQND
ncbi:MAG: sugar ABC transporter substrate-binding protein, partial [Clostridia bacterium]|nr:sugar ABC transporter substrate-binding protein [Clostridia bacterium]